MYSGAAMDLADRFQLRMAGLKIPQGDYLPGMTAPDGPSTGGGVQALQHIRLVPRAQGMSPLLVGTANAKAGVAELRVYDLVQAQHQQRFKQPAPLDRAAYESFLKAASDFFAEAKLTPMLVTQSADTAAVATSIPAPAMPSSASSRVAGIVLLVMAVLALAGMAAWYVLLRHH
jgi:hypothetical protein